MLIKYCKTNNNKKPEVSLRVRLRGWWAGRPDALGSGHHEGLSMGETSDPSPEGQRGNPVRTGDGGGVSQGTESKSPGGEKGSPERLGRGQKLEDGGARAGRTRGAF